MKESATIYKVSIVDNEGHGAACTGYYSGLAAIKKRFGRIIGRTGEDIDYLSDRTFKVFFQPWESEEERKRSQEFMAMLGQPWRETWYLIEPSTFYFCAEDQEPAQAE